MPGSGRGPAEPIWPEADVGCDGDCGIYEIELARPPLKRWGSRKMEFAPPPGFAKGYAEASPLKRWGNRGAMGEPRWMGKEARWGRA